MKLPQVPPAPARLQDLQQYQEDICVARGWDKASSLETFLLFTEEVGELAKAIRHQLDLYVEKGKTADPEELRGEFADVFSYLMEMANKFGIDLEEAYRAKELRNAQRDWG
jgi:NTP pyrophosphatase (non-canonical NTP hydrolase)